jgi:hypothetical protein
MAKTKKTETPAKPRGGRLVWIPESPKYLGLYSTAGADNSAASTTWPWDARQFNTEAECKTWCDAHPVPAWVPVAHGFAGDK